MPLLALSGCGDQKTESSANPKTTAPQALEKSAEKGPVKLVVRLSPKEPRLSDLLDLDVTVYAALEVNVKPPAFGLAVGDFLVRDYVERPGGMENGKAVRNFHYRLEATHTGKHIIRSISIEFVDKRKDSESKGEPVVVETEPLEVMITSELSGQTPSLANLAPIVGPLPLTRTSRTIGILGGVGALALAILVVYLIVRSRRNKTGAVVVQRTPEEIAHEELAALLSENLTGKGLFKEFYVRLTGIVRRYIERTTGIRAPEQTTEEFLRDMRARQQFPFDRSQQLAYFLEAADMVKYAAMQPGERQVEEAVARAQEFVGLPSAFAPMPGVGIGVRGQGSGVRG